MAFLVAAFGQTSPKEWRDLAQELAHDNRSRLTEWHDDRGAIVRLRFIRRTGGDFRLHGHRREPGRNARRAGGRSGGRRERRAGGVSRERGRGPRGSARGARVRPLGPGSALAVGRLRSSGIAGSRVPLGRPNLSREHAGGGAAAPSRCPEGVGPSLCRAYGARSVVPTCSRDGLRWRSPDGRGRHPARDGSRPRPNRGRAPDVLESGSGRPTPREPLEPTRTGR